MIDIDPEEIYLYPLYIRELTGLGRTGKSPTTRRRELFLAARDELIAAGYQQQSMRLFRRRNVETATDYCCQDDGMIGIGPGARSYTRTLHYSSEYAVGQTGVRKIISDFHSRPAHDFALADYGVRLSAEEQRRRYVIKSLPVRQDRQHAGGTGTGCPRAGTFRRAVRTTSDAADSLQRGRRRFTRTLCCDPGTAAPASRQCLFVDQQLQAGTR